MGKQLQFGVETVTPALARKYLATSRGNRRLNRNRVLQYAADMKRKAWSLNGESIKFGVKGELIDGHHRLEACIVAGVSFRTGVIRNGTTKLDWGQPRTAADMLVELGQADCYRTAQRMCAIVRQIAQHCGHLQGLTVEEVLLLCEQYEPHLVRIADMSTRRVSGAASGMRPSPVAAAVVVFLAHSSGVSSQRQEHFVQQLHTKEELGHGDPALALLRFVATAEVDKKKRSTWELFHATCRAAQAYLESKPLGVISNRNITFKSGPGHFVGSPQTWCGLASIERAAKPEPVFDGYGKPFMGEAAR